MCCLIYSPPFVSVLLSTMSTTANVVCSGALGIKVKIMLPHDPRGIIGPKNPLPDHVTIKEPPVEEKVLAPRSEHKQEKIIPAAAPVAPQAAPVQPAY